MRACGVTCSGDDAWADHLKGKTHAKNERRREREREAEATGGPVGDAQKRESEKKGTARRTLCRRRRRRFGIQDQIISSETNVATASCVSELKQFQDRAYHQDPVKAKMRRRLVFGLREVAKAVQLKKAKAVVVAPNIEEVGLEGGLDDVVAAIIDAARGNGTPIVFALTRNRLGQIVGKRLRIQRALAVLDQSGADEQFKAMLAAAAAGRAAFKEEAERKKEKAAAEGARARAGAGASGSASSRSDRDEEVPSLNAAASMFVPRARTVPS